MNNTKKGAVAIALAAAIWTLPHAWASSVAVSGSGLQDTLNSVTSCTSTQCLSAGQGTISPNWLIVGDPTSDSHILAEVAGNAGANTFGIYDPNHPPSQTELSGESGTNYLQIYNGPSSVGDHAVLSYDPKTGIYDMTRYLADGTVDATASAKFSSGAIFGFYLNGPGGLFFSNSSLNETGTNYPNGTPHMLAFQGGSGLSVKLPPNNNLVPFTASDFIMAWEDLPYKISDFDYNDFVVLVDNVRPVPEPRETLMFGIGLLAIILLEIRRKRAWQPEKG